MSIKLMSAAWDLDIPSTEKMVLLCLCDFANDDGSNCWPAIAKVAARCSTSERTVQRAIRSLESMRILNTHERLGTSNLYRIDPRQIVRGDKLSGVTKTTERGDTVSPKPSRTINNNIKRAIPANWWPEEFGPNTKSAAIVSAWSADHLAAQVEQFKANHAAKGNKFCDPQAAWSTWVLNSEKFKARSGYGNGNNRSGSTWAIGQELLGAIDAQGNH